MANLDPTDMGEVRETFLTTHWSMIEGIRERQDRDRALIGLLGTPSVLSRELSMLSPDIEEPAAARVEDDPSRHPGIAAASPLCQGQRVAFSYCR